MISKIIKEELKKYEKDICNINQNKIIDCITIFSNSKDDYDNLNNELSSNKIVDEMPSGNLYYLSIPLNTEYGDLNFIKIRKYDENYKNYRISVDFTVDDYFKFKNNLNNPLIKIYESFELIQFKNKNSIINIVSLSAKEDYNLGDDDNE